MMQGLGDHSNDSEFCSKINERAFRIIRAEISEGVHEAQTEVRVQGPAGYDSVGAPTRREEPPHLQTPSERSCFSFVITEARKETLLSASILK